MKNLAKIGTVAMVCLIFLLSAGCGEPRPKGYYYKEVLLDVDCGDKFKGELYEMGHTTYSIYSIRYEDSKGRRVDLPKGECVKIELERYPTPPQLGR